MEKNKKSQPTQVSMVRPSEVSSISLADWQPGRQEECRANDGPLEAKLGWPSGTMAWLRAAFAAGASRGQWWCLRGIPEGQRLAVRQAAKVFRRGVGFGEPLIRGEFRPSSCHTFSQVDELPASLTAQGSGPENAYFLVVDRQVAIHWPSFIGGLASSENCAGQWVFDASEDTKSLTALADLVSVLPRECTVMAIGGGITLDLAGFAAGEAGCPWVAIPTTLLAMVDAAHGGKTGVNFSPWGKNQLGLFHSPLAVHLCSQFLTTLPVAEVVSGFAECLKHALLAADDESFREWLDLLQRIQATASWDDMGRWAYLIEKSCIYKAGIIAQDPFEQTGARELLNLGHTTAHALEALAAEVRQETGLTNPQFDLRHGNAVAVGLWFKLALASEQNASWVRTSQVSLEQSGILEPFFKWFDVCFNHNPDMLWQRLEPHLLHDKKNRPSDSALDQNRHISIVGLTSDGQPGGQTMEVSLAEYGSKIKALLRGQL